MLPWQNARNSNQAPSRLAGLEPALAISNLPFRRIFGFTLAELIVLVACVAILAAMLLSAVSRATLKVRSTYCKNNLHKLGLAVQMYAEDSKSIYPAYQTMKGALWETSLSPYYSTSWSNRLNQCPAYSGPLPEDWPVRDAGGGMVSSYGYNTWGVTWRPVKSPALNYCLGLGVDAVRISEERRVWGASTEEAPLVHRESQITAPSELFAFVDARGSTITMPSGNATTQVWAGWDSTDGTPVTGGAYPCLQGAPQHGSRFNVLSCDSHVSSVQISDLFERTPAPGQSSPPLWKSASHWNIDNQPHVEAWLFR
jgi:type II secretory pathway pseudopilin PulG